MDLQCGGFDHSGEPPPGRASEINLHHRSPEHGTRHDQQDIWDEKDLLFRAKVTIVLIDSNGKPIRLPAKLRRMTAQ